MRKLITLLLTYVIVQILIMLNVVNDYVLATLVTIGINIILAVSLNLITGFTGQFSLGHAGFMSIGAYVCALITMRVPTIWGFLLGVLLGAMAAALTGALVGLPTLRLRGDYLAIATLGMSEIIRIVFLNLEITNGAAGLTGIPQFVNWTWLFIFTVGVVAVIYNFIKSAHGRACISVREDEVAAEAMGINTVKYKVIAFTIGAFCAGVAGAVYASYFYFLKPGLFDFLKSVDVLVIVVLGGLGSISGSILAAILLALISTYLQSFPELRMVLYSLTLIVIMIFRPQGLMGSKEISLSIFNKLGNNRFFDRFKTDRGRD
ncbi:MAG: branched-chain amino acid ABC transporter permease [Clostridiales bacterium]|nr:branched-chain amino acid ABC transporter permease [Clostridiales bacterium]